MYLIDYNSEILTSSTVGYMMIHLGFLVILNFKSELLFKNAGLGHLTGQS